MSTALATPELRDLTRELASLEKRRAERPLVFAKRLPWQQVAWALITGFEWRSEWGPKPSRKPRTICVVSANRTGKSVFGGMALSAAALGYLHRFKKAGESWGGMPSLGDSVTVQRPHVEAWVGKGARWTPKSPSMPTQSVCRTDAGGVIRCKAYEQGRDKWQGGKCQVIAMDEQPPDDVLSEARTRLIDEDGLLLAIFTPLGGVQSVLYGECYDPWLEYQAKHPGAQWGEVSPGTWVISIGMRDNAMSIGGYLPDDSIEAGEDALVAQGRLLEARVRYHGEWLDISEDRIIPVENLATWGEEPRGGWVDTVAWIDPAYSQRTSNCRSSIAVVSTCHAGKVYLRASEGGHWSADERERACIDTLKRFDFPNTYVQRVGGDMEFAKALNGALMRDGARACVQPWPIKGMVPDKVTRANTFAPMVSAGQFMCRPEHVEFKRQAGLFSASYLKAGGLCDDLDAAMGAALKIVDQAGHPLWRDAVTEGGAGWSAPDSSPQAEQANDWRDDADDDTSGWAYQGDLGPEGWVD